MDLRLVMFLSVLVVLSIVLYGISVWMYRKLVNWEKIVAKFPADSATLHSCDFDAILPAPSFQWRAPSGYLQLVKACRADMRHADVRLSAAGIFVDLKIPSFKSILIPWKSLECASVSFDTFLGIFDDSRIHLRATDFPLELRFRLSAVKPILARCQQHSAEQRTIA